MQFWGKRKFTGKDFDEETQLYYFNARWYDPTLGKFTSEDPVKDGINWYAYCGNNPIAFIDPKGLWIENEDGSYTAEEGDTLYGLGNKLNKNWREFDYKGDPKNLKPGTVVNPKFNLLGATINTFQNLGSLFNNIVTGPPTTQIDNLTELEIAINNFISQLPEEDQEEVRDILESALMFTDTGDSLAFWQGEMTAERAALWSYVNNNGNYQCQAYFCDLMKRELGDTVYSTFYNGNYWNINGIWSNNDAAYRLDPDIFTEDMVQQLGDMGFVLPFTATTTTTHIAYVGHSGMTIFSNPEVASGTYSNGDPWVSDLPQGGTISNYSNRDALLLIQAGTFTGAIPSIYGTNGWGNSNETQFDTGAVNIYLIILE